ncbi:MAG: hypothetical protein JO186_07695 [Actinobacteria bacterium]|nr:hypothetical protein [Actinomycetota bacterium]MBV8395142.1 hypothetical protein [Actinomycetota bacterium]
MGRLAILGLLVALVAAGCGGQSRYSLEKTRSCLSSEGVTTSPATDFVATTATGGAFRAKLADNQVTIAFGEKDADAIDIAYAYQRFAFPNVRGNILDVLERYRNAVLLWRDHPQSADLALVTGCLK